MVVIARGFGFSITRDAAAATDGDDLDVRRNDDAIAVLRAVRRLINESLFFLLVSFFSELITRYRFALFS